MKILAMAVALVVLSVGEAHAEGSAVQSGALYQGIGNITFGYDETACLK
ncbi:MAG: hypothetical protein J7L69_08310 [Desulfobulbaceae bacterium]|nr:hypothetical protein [Desulfobulbaceae bacterium]